VTLPHGRAAAVARLAPGATLTTLLDRRRGEARAVLAARLGRRPVTLIARVAGPDELVLEAIRPGAPALDGELEATRSLAVKLSWTHVPLEQAKSLAYPGVYIVDRNEEPVYIGQSTHIGRRWTGQLLTIDQLRLRACAASDTLWAGKLENPPSGAALPVALKGAEHVLVRMVYYWLKERGKPQLTNRSSIREFVVGSGGVSLQNTGTRPKYVEKNLTRAPGNRYELAEATP
jgi:hypothetical protein